MTVLQATCQAVEKGEAEYSAIIGLPMKTRTQWLPSGTADRLENDAHYDEVIVAEQLLVNGSFESVWEYITHCHVKGINLSSADLKDIWAEYWDSLHDEQIENEVNDMIEANA